MAKPIIFSLLLGNKDQILEKINNQEAENKLPIIPLKVNKESHISDKERIFSEILEKSRKESKIPIFNIQLNNNDAKPIFQLQDLINAKNLNIKTTITFDQYNSLTQNPELETYWKKIMDQVDHVFFTNEADQNLAINENIINKDKTTTIKDVDTDLALVFNNLIYNREIDQLLSDTIPDKAKLDKIIKNAKNQGGRVIIETWPISADEATNLITTKFGITSEDQIYGLKLEINEILKDTSNAAQNLTKYVSQISAQFQKDLGKAEVNPIDFNFNTGKVMKDNLTDIQAEQTTPYEPPKENQPQPQGFFRRVFNYFKDIVTSFLGKKEEPKTQTPATLTTPPPEQPKSEPTITKEPQVVAAPTQQAPINDQKPWEKLGVSQQMYEEAIKAEERLAQSTKNIASTPSVPRAIQDDPFRVPLEIQDINNVKKSDYWYEGHQIQYLLKEALPEDKFSVQPTISLKQNIHLDLLPDEQKPENVLKNAVSQVIDGGKESAVIPIEMGYGHWAGVVATYDKNDKQIILTFNDSLGNSINYDGQKLPKLLDKALSDLPNKPIIIDEQTKQQNNNLDCGVFTVDNLTKLAQGKPILTTKEAENKGQELRNQHAQILTRVMTKQQAIAIGQQSRNTSSTSNKFQNLINSQKTKDTERSR